MDKEFFYNLWNLFNHVDEIAMNREAKRIVFTLDGKWKITRLPTGETHTIDAALDLCAWLNQNEYKPTGRKPVDNGGGKLYS